MHRFFVPAADATGSVVALPEEEAAHLTRVLRLKVGDAVRVFDGRGREWTAEVSDIGKLHTMVQLRNPVEPAREPQIDIALAMAVLKSDKMDDVVRNAVMLGVRRLVPLVTDRTEIAFSTIGRRGRIPRWQRIAVASAKQCGRAVVPEVLDAVILTTALELTSTSTRLLFVDPQSQAAALPIRDVERSRELTIFVGPEGGWTDTELGTARNSGAVLTTLGTHTLRADAAPMVAITALRVLWEDL